MCYEYRCSNIYLQKSDMSDARVFTLSLNVLHSREEGAAVEAEKVVRAVLMTIQDIES